MKHAFALAASAWLLVGSAYAQIRRVGNGYLLRAHYRAGERLQYQAATAIGGFGEANTGIQVKFSMLLAVAKVKQGVATIRVTMAPAKFSGKETVPMKFPPTTFQVDSLNRIQGTSNGSQVLLTFPAKPVAVGQKWTGTTVFTLGAGQSGGAISTVYRLAGVKSQNGKTIAEIDFNLLGYIKGKGSALLDTSDGSLLSAVYDLSITPPTQGSGPHPVVLTIRRAM